MNSLALLAFVISTSSLIIWGFGHAADFVCRMSVPPKERHKGDSDNAWKKSEPVTGLRKIDTLINTLNNLLTTDDRPAVWRICESLIKSLVEIKEEHEDELEEVRVIARGMQAKSEECENERRAAEAKVTELQGQLRAMSDLANSAMADAQKWQNAYLKLRVETPIVHNIDVTWRNGEIPDGAIIMSQQAKTAREAQEERIPRNGFHEYRVKYYNYDDHRWHDTELWSDGVTGVEDWVRENCGSGVPVYDCKVVA